MRADRWCSGCGPRRCASRRAASPAGSPRSSRWAARPCTWSRAISAPCACSRRAPRRGTASATRWRVAFDADATLIFDRASERLVVGPRPHALDSACSTWSARRPRRRCEPPSQEERAALLRLPPTRESHAAALARHRALFDRVEVAPPPAATRTLAGPARIAFWNAERGKDLDASAALLGALAADVLLLCELDLGMARSGQAHTTRELAERLGTGYAFAVEFLELGLGDAREQAWHAGEVNQAGLHGAAILSAFALERPAVIRLETDGDWFDGRHGERRVGGRIAVAATLAIDHTPVTLVSVHFESHGDPAQRASQMRPAARGDRCLCAGPAGADRRRPQHLDGEPRLGARHRRSSRSCRPCACSTRCPSSPCSRSRPGTATTGEPATRWASPTQRTRPDGTPAATARQDRLVPLPGPGGERSAQRCRRSTPGRGDLGPRGAGGHDCARTVAEGRARAMKLISYNIQYGKGKDGRYDLARIAGEIEHADVIALQEVERFWQRSGERDEPAELARHLRAFHWVYGANLDMDASYRRSRTASGAPAAPVRHHDPLAHPDRLQPQFSAAQVRHAGAAQHPAGRARGGDPLRPGHARCGSTRSISAICRRRPGCRRSRRCSTSTGARRRRAVPGAAAIRTRPPAGPRARCRRCRARRC